MILLLLASKYLITLYHLVVYYSIQISLFDLINQNIKNIHNIVFLHPSKSVVRVLQSIGRGLRMSETKDRVMVFDLVDDLRHKKYRNHAFNHFLERIKIYESESFSFNLVPIDL